MPLVRFESARSDAVTVRVPAKINVYLEVRGLRTDGYHAIDTVMLPVGLEDRLTARRVRGTDVSLRIRRPGGVPLDGTNTVLRAARALREAAGVAAGATLILEKRIPVGAGLGGGSADAAGALVALDRLWRCRAGPAALSALAASIGSDVPFFLGDGPARATGRGERVSPVPCRGAFHAVLVYPGVPLSTGNVYEKCKARLTRVRRSARLRHILSALRGGNAAALGAHLRNDLEAAAVSLAPSLRTLHADLDRLLFLGVGMTGSGSAFFGVCAGRAEALARARAVGRAGLGRAWAVEMGRL